MKHIKRISVITLVLLAMVIGLVGQAFAADLPEDVSVPFSSCTPIGNAKMAASCIEWITTVGSGFSFTYNNETDRYLQAEVGLTYSTYVGGDTVSILSEEISTFQTAGFSNWSDYRSFDSVGYVTLKPGVNTITFRSDVINGKTNVGYNVTEIRLSDFRLIEHVDFNRKALFTVDDLHVFGNAKFEPASAPYTNVGYMARNAGDPETGFWFTCVNLSDKPVYATVGAKLTTSCGSHTCCTYAITANGEEPLFDALYTPPNFGTWDVNKYTTVDSLGTVVLQPGENTVRIAAHTFSAYGMNVKEVYLSNFRESTDLTYDSKLTFGLGDFTLSGKAVFEPASAPHTNVGYMIKDAAAPEQQTGITFTYVNWQSTPVYATVGAKLTTNCPGHVCTAYAVTANGQEPLVDSVYLPPNFGTWDVSKYTVVDRIGTILLQPGENTITIAADTLSDYGMNVQEVYLTEFIPASAAIERLECVPAELEAYVGENVKLPADLVITAYFADGTSAQVEDYRLTVLDEDLLHLSGTTLTGLKEGETALKLYYGAASLNIPVKIIDRTPTIKLDKAQFMTNSGKTVPVTAVLSHTDAPVVWTSDNEAVVTVDQNGNVTAHAQGDAFITAKAGDLTATCRVSVDYEGQNPILPPSWGLYICDPEPCTIDGRMYIFGSTDHPMGRETDGSYGYCGTEYHVLYTDDMVNWTDAGIILTLEDIPAEYRGGSRLWGPGALFKAAEEGREEKYYFIANTNGYSSGMVLFEADSPTGPFGNPRAMMKDGKVLGNLDPGVLADDDGKVYFAYQYDGYKFAVCQLNPADFSQILSDTVVDVTDVFKAGNPNEWPDEGQSLKKRGDTYYYLNMLTYDSNNTHRIPVKMAYLMADSPLGPWRYGGKIVDTYHYLDSSNIQGSFAELNGQWYVAYHMPTPDASNSRYCWIDPITFNEDGTIRQIEPTSSGAKGSFRVGEKIQASSGVHFSGGRGDKRIVQRYEGNLSQWWKDDFRFTDYPETWYSAAGQFIGYRYMNFTAEINTFEITARTTGEGAVLKIYQGARKGSANDAPGDGLNQPAKDGPTGDLLAVVELPNTNGQYQTFTVPAAVAEEGTHSFYIVLETAPTQGNVYVDSMRFDQVRSPFDVNGDGVVNLLDMTRAQRWYDTDNAEADVNDDGTVDIEDLILIFKNFYGTGA